MEGDLMSDYELNKTIKRICDEFIDNHFEFTDNLRDVPVWSQAPDTLIQELLESKIPNEGRPLDEVYQQLQSEVYKYSLIGNHPRSFGFVPGVPTKLSFLGDMMTSAYNLHGSNWINASAASTLESNMIRWLGSKIGYSEVSGGIFVSGGSMANLTGIVAGRDHSIPEDKRHLGIAYISDQTHHSVEKGLLIAGFTHNQIRKIASNELFQIDVDALQKSIVSDLEKGLIPGLIIASAGTTNTGSVDNIQAISELATKHNIWLHVDGAYGASFLLSNKHRHQLNGIENADSVSWDAHKLLFQTYSCAMVLVKNKSSLLNSFSANPEYLDDIGGSTMDDFGSLGIELTRPTRALKLWLSLQVIGLDQFERMIDGGHELALYTEKEVLNQEDWEIVSNPQFSILNFRYANSKFDNESLNKINKQVANEIVDSGYAGVFTTQLKGKTVLRMCTINPNTTHEDIDNTLSRLNELAIHYAKLA